MHASHHGHPLVEAFTNYRRERARSRMMLAAFALGNHGVDCAQRLVQSAPTGRRGAGAL